MQVLVITIIVSGIFIASYKFSSKSSQPPKILLSEEEWDFGLVKPEEKSTHIFTIKNEGDADLIVNKAETHEHIKHNINVPLNIIPENDYEVSMIYDSTEHNLGEIREAMRIFCNVPGKESLRKLKNIFI